MTSTPPPSRPDHALRRGLAAIVVVVLLLAIAIWKPWEGSRTGTVQSTVPPGASSSLLPAITGGPGSEATPGGS